MASVEAQLRQNESAADQDLEVEITSKNVNGGSSTGSAAPPNSRKQKYKAPPQKKTKTQVMGQCRICGYLSSQDVCKACVLLEGLNKARPKNKIEVGYEPQEEDVSGITTCMQSATITGV